MPKENRKIPVLSLGNDFRAVIVEIGGAEIKLEVSNDNIVLHADRPVTTKLRAKSDEAASNNSALQVGDKWPDGWIYAGISPDTGKPFSVAPEDSGVMRWKAAMKYAARQGSRLPSKAELNVLYENKDKGALAGTFNETGSYPAGWYWSSSEYTTNLAWDQRFSDGSRDYYYRSSAESVRCVRDEPRLTR